MNNDDNSGSFWWGFMAFVVTPILILWGQSYTPDEFDINEDTPERQHVWNMSALDKVTKLHPDAMSLSDSAVAAIMYPGRTQFATEFNTVVNGGEGLRFHFRTTRHDYAQDKNRGLSLTYSSAGVTIEENGTVVQRIDSLRALPDTPTRILIENHGNYYSISVGCSRICYKSTSLPATEYVILETLSGTNASVKDVTFVPAMQ